MRPERQRVDRGDARDRRASRCTSCVDARVSLEVPLAGLAAQNATEADRGRAARRRSPRPRGNDPASEAFRVADTRFHRVIASDGAQRAPARVHELDARRAAAVADRHDRRLDRRRLRSCDQHRVIQRAIRLRQPAAAQRAMRRHLDYLRELVERARLTIQEEHRESGTHARVPPAARVRRAAGARAVARRPTCSSGSAAPGVCATDLHAIEGLMEPAGVTLPRVLGHENAGWVEEIGAGVTTVAKGDAVLVYPPYSCGLCVALPPRQRHALRAPRVHRPDGRRRLRRLRARPGALARCALPGRRRAGRGRAARRRRASPPTTPCGGSRISPCPARPPS